MRTLIKLHDAIATVMAWCDDDTISSIRLSGKSELANALEKLRAIWRQVE